MTENETTWSENYGSTAKAMAIHEENNGSYTGVYKGSSAASHRSYAPPQQQNISTKPSYGRSDYETFRPDSAVSQDKRRMIRDCVNAYKNVGLIRNVIDLMGDFACQGVSLVHRDKSAESFFQQWFKQVNGKERSERFLNNLYRSGQVVVYESYADVDEGLRKYMKALAGDIKVKNPTKEDRIPFAYTFFNPLSLDVKADGDLYLNVSGKAKIGGHFGTFDSQSQRTANMPKSVFDKLPKGMREQINKNKGQVRLENGRLSVFHYKKDDWEQWADPMIHAIIDDVGMLEKMKLADMSALDGAISNIRLWTLGDFEHKILPTKEGIDRLRNILANNQGGGTMELVWGPELKFTESNTEVHKFLGSEKYNSVWNSIYAGLGVPPTLTGMSGNGGGFTNNFISLKTLVERLQYGRDLLIKFWQAQVEKVRKAMGFRYAPEVVFDQMSLSDEAAEKNLLIQLADRNIISDETLLERFKETPTVERVRLKREIAAREGDGMPDKAGPFHNARHVQELEKMGKQKEFDDDTMKKTTKEEKEKLKFQYENEPKPPAPAAGPGGSKKPGGAKKPTPKGNGKPNGRPKNSKDSAPRKQRQAKPKSKPGVAELIRWSEEAWDNSSEVLTKAFLGANEKKTVRQLTKAQVKQLENLKVEVFTNLEPMEPVGKKEVYAVISGGKRVPQDLAEAFQEHDISIDTMPVEAFRRSVIGHYVESFWLS